MNISLIAATGRDREIGAQNRLIWTIRRDLRLFRETTWGHHLLMGRKTWESIGRPLPERRILVLSRQEQELPPSVDLVTSIPQAIALASSRGEDELFVAGGGQIYQQCLELAHRLILSRIQATAPFADSWFPEFPASQWNLVRQTFYDSEDNAPAFSHEILERIWPESEPPPEGRGLKDAD